MPEVCVAELARRSEISRKTAYKWIDRFLCGCELNDRRDVLARVRKLCEQRSKTPLTPRGGPRAMNLPASAPWVMLARIAGSCSLE